MTAKIVISNRRRLGSALLVGTMLGGIAAPAAAQTGTQPPAPAAQPPAPAVQQPVTTVTAEPTQVVRSITVAGTQRIEPETVLSYTRLRAGEPYTTQTVDQAIADLYATDLFADVAIRGVATGDLVIEVRENPIINRIILEGNRRLSDSKITPEIRLAPRQIFTRSRARADVARIIELYRRQGRFAATVEPQIVQLDQNRVDVVFAINEGPRSRVRQINILGNEAFDDGQLRSEMATREAAFWRVFSSSDTYDPDRLAYDQQKLRQFYLTQGYADFRVVSAVAELTPDRRDFIITYVVEEGERYRFGDVTVDSNIRDLPADQLRTFARMNTGDWFNAQQVEDTVTTLNEAAGLAGYAFADVRPIYRRDPETRTMGITFQIAEAPRVYVERIEISGNTNTRDKVVRREFRLAEGDPFNSLRVRRSRDRIQSLGFFQENLEITQTQGSAPDRVVLGVAVQERPTGQIQLQAGFSSLERFLINASIQQRNFRGLGQELRASVNYSSYSRSIELGFTEPFLFDRNIALGFDVFRRDLSSFNTLGNQRNRNFQQVTTGTQLRSGVPLTENLSLALRYGLNYDQISLDQGRYYSVNEQGVNACDPLLAGRYLCEAEGNRLSSTLGYSLLYSTLDNAIRPTRGRRLLLSQDFAGLGGDVRYLRSRLTGAQYWNVGRGFIFSVTGEGGYIHSFEEGGPGRDPVRLTDRFYLGEPQIRGFDIRGVGPRIQRIPYELELDSSGNPVLVTDRDQIRDEPLGGRAYYLARAELEIPLGSGARDLGLRPSVFLDIGSVFGIRAPITEDYRPGDPRLQRPVLNLEGLRQCSTGGTSPTITPIPAGASCPLNTTLVTQAIALPFREVFLGDTPRPRLSIGIGVNWNSPFGPFRIDIAHALLSEEGDDTKLISFNVGTAF